MIPGGRDPFEDPEEPDEQGDDPAAGGGSGGSVGEAGGWVPPAERPWRHPSELGRVESGAGGTGPASGQFDVGGSADVLVVARPRRAATLGVVVAAMAAVVIGSLLLVSTGEGSGTPGSAFGTDVEGPVTAAAVCCHLTPTAARRAETGLVAIERPSGRGALLGCGVVVAGAGLVATAADAVSGRRWVRVLTTGGRRLKATVEAVDRGSDVALLSVPATLPVARFADDGNIGSGFPATAVVMATRRGRTGAAGRWSRVAVRSVGTPLPDGAAAGMAAIVTEVDALPDVPGEPLLDADGEVVGLLDPSGEPASGTRAYLPASLVVGVAEQLAMTGRVSHGWLGLQGTDAPVAVSSTTAPGVGTSTLSSEPTSTATESTTGAEVVAVDPGGPAAHVLQPGDIIVGVDGHTVRSIAELRDRLYVLAPNTSVLLTIVRGGQLLTEVVDLAPSP